MKSRIYENLTILAATAVAPVGLLTYLQLQETSSELLQILSIYFLAHILIWLVLIPAFRRFPRASFALCALLYPGIAFAGMLFIINPLGAIYGLLWYGPYIYFKLGWATIPVSAMSAAIAYILTRNKTETNNTERGSIAPIS